MRPDALVIDLDDTLLNTEKVLSAKNRTALKELIASGIHIFLCSGRPTEGMKVYMNELFGSPESAPESYFISFNGARIDRWDTGENLYAKMVPAAKAAEIVRFADQYEIIAQVYDDYSFIANRYSQSVQNYHLSTGMPYSVRSNMADHISEDSPKILLHSTAEKISNVIPYAKDLFSDCLNVIRSQPVYIDIMHKEVDKASAMKSLIRLLGIKLEQTLAIGDSLNDLEMVASAGLGIAVANAMDDVKHAADVVLPCSNDENALDFVAHSFFN